MHPSYKEKPCIIRNSLAKTCGLPISCLVSLPWLTGIRTLYHFRGGTAPASGLRPCIKSRSTTSKKRGTPTHGRQESCIYVPKVAFFSLIASSRYKSTLLSHLYHHFYRYSTYVKEGGCCRDQDIGCRGWFRRKTGRREGVKDFHYR